MPSSPALPVFLLLLSGVLDRLIQYGLLVTEEVGRAAGDEVPARGLAPFSSLLHSGGQFPGVFREATLHLGTHV